MSFKLYFAGAEHPGWRKQLAEHGVGTAAVNFTHLFPRLKEPGEWRVDDHFPLNCQVVLYYTEGDWTPSQRSDIYEAYLEVALANRRSLDHVLAPPVDAEEWMVPMWRQGMDTSEHPWVAVTNDTLSVGHHLTSVQSLPRAGTSVLGIGVSNGDLLRRAGLAATTSTGWTNATRYGEIAVWDGAGLRRYARPESRPAAVRKHAQHIRQAGVEPAGLSEDSHGRVQLALWSWRKEEESIATQRPRPLPLEVQQASSSTVAPTVGRERTTLPVLVSHEGGVSASSRSLRKCNNCFVSASCPAFEPDASCQFEIPVRISTKDELVASLLAMADMQSQRVWTLRFAEEINGGYPDAQLSEEIDRLVRVSEKIKKITDDRDFLNISVEAAGNGIISQLFGPRAGEQARSLEQPVPSDGIIESFARD